MKARLTGNSRAGLFLFLAVYACALAALLPVLSLWLDEIYDLIVARMDRLSDVLAYVPHVSGNVPLNYVIQFASVHLLGFSAFTGRLPSAISSVMACAGVFVLAKRMGLRRPLLAAGIFALFPLQLRYALEARPYELALCLSVWATVAFLRVLDRPESASRAALYGLSVAAGLFTFPYVLFVPLAHLMWAALVSYRTRRWQPLLAAALAVGIAGLIFAPWYLHSAASWRTAVVIGQLKGTISLRAVPMILRELVAAGYIGSLLVLAGFGYGLARRQDWPLWLLYSIVPIVCAVAADAWFGYFLAIRQMIFVLAPLALLFTAGVEALPRRPAATGGYTAPTEPARRPDPGVSHFEESASVQLRVVTDQPWDVKADVLAIPIVGEPAFDGALGELNRRASGELAALAAFGELRAKRFTSSVSAAGELAAGRVLTISAGDVAILDRETVLHVGAAAEHRLGGRHVRSLAIWLTPLADVLDGGVDAVAELIARGVVEGTFEPKTLYRDHDDIATAPPILEELILVAPGADAASAQKAAERGVIIGEGANHAKSLSNRSANDISPEVLAQEARDVAAKHGLWIDVIEPDRARELGMGMFLAVGQGSDNPPRMIVMRSGGEGEKDALDRHLAIVGKGVCFDSGGISIKPADRMEEMKMDKIGACTVIAAIGTVARLAPGTPLLAVAPAVENMPGSHSTRPGDVVKALNGKWVDITNTDAEGRLILGDAMTYAERLGATHIVDVATLTGAVSRAFGHLITGAFGTPQAWYDDVMIAAGKAAERYWQIPLLDDYVPDMESWYGDLQNSGSAEGSLIKSGLFLREFRTVPWAHLDIGGTGYFRKTTAYAPRGATGVTHATLVELALAGAKA